VDDTREALRLAQVHRAAEAERRKKVVNIADHQPSAI